MRVLFFACLLMFVSGWSASFAAAQTPGEMLAQYSKEAGRPAEAGRGQAFFKANHGQAWQCTSCHTQSPLSEGQHIVTNKSIAPLAPAANPRRFTDSAKVEKWFRRNCKDVLARACTAAEKADVLAWLIALR